MIKWFIFLLPTVFCMHSTAQNKAVDSLQAILVRLPDDSSKVRTLNALCVAYTNSSDYKAMLKYAEQSVQLAKKIGFKDGLAEAYWCVGFAHSYDTYFNDKKVDYTEGLRNYFTAEKLGEEAGDKKLLTRICYDIGDDWEYQSDFTRALEYFLKSLRYAEESGDQDLLIGSQLKVAKIYEEFSDSKKSLQYLNMACELVKKSQDTLTIISVLNTTGENLRKNKQYDLALLKHQEALALTRKKKALDNEGVTLLAMGKVYMDQGQNALALDYFLESYKQLRSDNIQRRNICLVLSAIAEAYYKQKKYPQALDYYKQSLDVAGAIGLSEVSAECDQSLSQTYAQLNNYKLSLEYYKKYIAARDSIYSQENTKKLVRSEMNFEFAKQRTIQQAEIEKQELNHKEAIKRKNTFLYFGVSLGVIILSFLVIFLNRFRLIQQQKKLIEKQNRNMHANIVNAKSLQDNILPSQQMLDRLLPTHFILYLPKETVSGDFYWVHESKGLVFVALADCTGHGVTGALMSMLGYSLLNDIVINKKIHSPEEILNLLNQEVIGSLNQNSTDNTSMDGGMDIALCCIDKASQELRMASAHQPIYIVKKSGIEVIKGDEFSIGWQLNGRMPAYKKITVKMEQVCAIYFSSDGLCDQMTRKTDIGPNKKFSSTRLLNMITEISQLNISQQKQHVNQLFEEWKGDNDQTDDVLVMGIKF